MHVVPDQPQAGCLGAGPRQRELWKSVDPHQSLGLLPSRPHHRKGLVRRDQSARHRCIPRRHSPDRAIPGRTSERTARLGADQDPHSANQSADQSSEVKPYEITSPALVEVHMRKFLWRYRWRIIASGVAPRFRRIATGGFKEPRLFEQLFKRLIAQCLEVGLVRGDKPSVYGTLVEANASKERRIPRERLAQAAQVNRTVREWLRNWKRRIQ